MSQRATKNIFSEFQQTDFGDMYYNHLVQIPKWFHIRAYPGVGRGGGGGDSEKCIVLMVFFKHQVGKVLAG